MWRSIQLHITNFHFPRSNIPSSPAYGVFISQLIRYARICTSYECFIPRVVRLPCKLLGQGYVRESLKSSLRKFYGRYGDLIKNEVSLSQRLHDILGHFLKVTWHSWTLIMIISQRHPPLIRHFTKSWLCYRTWPYYRFDIITKFREVSRRQNICNGCG